MTRHNDTDILKRLEETMTTDREEESKKTDEDLVFMIKVTGLIILALVTLTAAIGLIMNICTHGELIRDLITGVRAIREGYSEEAVSEGKLDCTKSNLSYAYSLLKSSDKTSAPETGKSYNEQLFDLHRCVIYTYFNNESIFRPYVNVKDGYEYRELRKEYAQTMDELLSAFTYDVENDSPQTIMSRYRINDFNDIYGGYCYVEIDGKLYNRRPVGWKSCSVTITETNARSAKEDAYSVTVSSDDIQSSYRSNPLAASFNVTSMTDTDSEFADPIYINAAHELHLGDYWSYDYGHNA